MVNIDLSRDDIYLIPSAGFIGQFYVTPESRVFHASVTCGRLQSSVEPIWDVPIVTLEGEYVRSTKHQALRRRTLEPCSTCKPLEGGLKVEPVDFPHAVCLDRDDEWVRDFRSGVDTILQPQRECMKCPHLEECYALFERERPPLGVMGGCTDAQYREYGHACLAIMKAKVKDEDRKEA